MEHEPRWWTLAEALERVKKVTPDTEDEAKANICRAIADRVVNIRGKLREHTSKPMTSGDVLAGDCFEIPDEIKMEELEWEHSRPQKAWSVRRGTYHIPGLWYLDWIKVFGRDVTEHLLCPREQSKAAQGALSDSRKQKPARA
jgi:hypothetical protein